MDRSAVIARLRELPPGKRVITALDVPTAEKALDLATALGPGGHFVKVGLELFSSGGPEVVERLRSMDRRIFLDLKYHDIPNTVASAARVAATLGADLCTIHACSGRAALTAAAEAMAGVDGPRPALLAVTVLTSLDEEQLQETGPSADGVQERVERLASLAWDCGCDGLVCSAADLPRLRGVIGPEPLVVTPGIRPAGADVQDQKRVATPRAALESGADFLVVGRPITRAENPATALAGIAAELEQTS
ncbi:MAG: orotidine-5'-phosphate decarboxylase [bacterium]|nr:orotidine-5'-phosphate decarboxylase [bacterium]